jgi:hypothetical protein
MKKVEFNDMFPPKEQITKNGNILLQIRWNRYYYDKKLITKERYQKNIVKFRDRYFSSQHDAKDIKDVLLCFIDTHNKTAAKDWNTRCNNLGWISDSEYDKNTAIISIEKAEAKGSKTAVPTKSEMQKRLHELTREGKYKDALAENRRYLDCCWIDKEQYGKNRSEIVLAQATEDCSRTIASIERKNKL